MIILSGIDITNNKRIKKLINRSPEAINDIFSIKEIEYCMKKKFPEQSFGARFSVKEAILKATNSDIFEFDLSKIETVNLKSGKPIVNINCPDLDKKIQKELKKSTYNISISLSHEKEYSVAHVIIY